MKYFVYIMAFWTLGLLLARFYFAPDIRRHFGLDLFASFAIITFAAVVVSSPPIFWGACFLCFFIGVRTPLDAGCRFLLLTALVPNVTVQINPGGIDIMGLQPMLVFAIAFALVCVARGRSTHGAASRLSSEDLACFVLALVITFGTYRVTNATTFLRQITALVLILLPLYLLTRHSGKREEARALMGVVAAAGAMLAMIALYEALRGWSLYDSVWQHLNAGEMMTRNLRVRGGLLRAPTTFTESTSFAVFQLSATIIALFARTSFRSTPTWLLCCAQLVVGLLCAQSRGALLGLFMAITVTFMLRRAYAKAAGMAAAAVAVVAALLLLARTNSRIHGFVQADAALDGTDYRQRLFARGLEVGLRHLWFGTDSAQLTQSLSDMTQGEHIVDLVNSYLSLFLTGGLIGLGAFLLPLAVTYFKLWRALGFKADGEARRQQTCAAGMLTGVLAALAFTSLYERNPFWLLLALSFAKIALYPRPKARHVLSPGMVAS